MRLTFLGTGAGYPTPERNVTALALEHGQGLYLLDCGEGTLRALQYAGIGFGRLRGVFLSHFHADHCLGLPGLLQSLNLLGRQRPLAIYGPPGLRDFLHRCRTITPFAPKFVIVPSELEPPGRTALKGLTVTCAWMDHTAPVLGYRFRAPDELGTLGPVCKLKAKTRWPQSPT